MIARIMMKRATLFPLAAAVTLLLAACGSVGPATVAHDRLAYARVTADSAKQQTLLNIVGGVRREAQHPGALW